MYILVHVTLFIKPWEGNVLVSCNEILIYLILIEGKEQFRGSREETDWIQKETGREVRTEHHLAQIYHIPCAAF